MPTPPRSTRAPGPRTWARPKRWPTSRWSSVGRREALGLDLDHAAAPSDDGATFEEDGDEGGGDRGEDRHHDVGRERPEAAAGTGTQPAGDGLGSEVTVEGEQVEERLPHPGHSRSGQVPDPPDLEPSAGEQQGGRPWGRLDPTSARTECRPVLRPQPSLQA